MVPPSKRFKPIQKIASHKERKAAAALGESIKQREAAEKRLQDLRQYHAEYLEGFARARRNGISGSQVLRYQGFISQLETAISQQEEIVNESQKACDTSKERWRGRYTKSKAMENVIGRLKKAERTDLNRKEQSESDERAQRKR